MSLVVTSGGGSATPAITTTDSTGAASTSWTLGLAAGAQTLEARVTGVLPVPVQATAIGRGNLRVANLSPDMSAIDFCVAPTGSGTFSAPVMAAAGEASGLVYGGDGSRQISRYFWYFPGTYDIRVFDKGLVGSSCSNPVLALTGVTVANDSYRTVAAVGVAGSATAPHRLVAFIDEATVAPPGFGIRFINAGMVTLSGSAPSPLPALNIGFTVASTYSGVFTNVAYPGTAAAGGVVDANGYATLDPAGLAAGAQITACPYPASPALRDLLVLAHAFGDKRRSRRQRLHHRERERPSGPLLCGDNVAPPTAGYNYSLCTATAWSSDPNRLPPGLGPVALVTDVDWPVACGTGSGTLSIGASTSVSGSPSCADHARGCVPFPLSAVWQALRIPTGIDVAFWPERTDADCEPRRDVESGYAVSFYEGDPPRRDPESLHIRGHLAR